MSAARSSISRRRGSEGAAPDAAPPAPPANWRKRDGDEDRSFQVIGRSGAAAETKEVVERRGPDTIYSEYSDSRGGWFYRGIGALTRAVHWNVTSRRGCSVFGRR
jgi:hypothetical protein